MFKILIFYCCYHAVFAAKLQSPIVDVVLNEIQIKNYAPDIVPILDFKLVPWHGRNTINGTFMFAKAVHKMQIKLSLNFIKPDKTRFEVLDAVADACDTLNGVHNRQTIAKLILSLLNKQTRFPKKCPLEVNKTYGLEYFSVDTPQFPLPNLKFIVVITTYTADKANMLYELFIKGATKRYRN